MAGKSNILHPGIGCLVTSHYIRIKHGWLEKIPIHFFRMIFPFQCLRWEMSRRTPKMVVAFGEPQVSLGNARGVRPGETPYVPGVQLGL
jgi:hypothetical protein